MMAKLMFGEYDGDQNDMAIDQEQEKTPEIELSQRVIRNLESKLFQMLTNSEILEDIEVIVAQNQIQKRKV